MSEPDRKLGDARATASSRPDQPASYCPTTGLTIPECSCQRCAEEQIRHHAPWVLDRRFGNQRQSRRAA